MSSGNSWCRGRNISIQVRNNFAGPSFLAAQLYMSSRKGIILTGVFACLDRAIVALCGLVTVIYFARILPKADFGLLTLTLCINILGIAFCDLAVGQALIHYGAGKRKQAFGDILFNGLLLKFAFFMLASIIIILFAGFISSFFDNGELAKVVKLIPLLILTTSLYNTYIQVVNAREQIRKMFCMDLFWLSVLAGGIYLTYRYSLISDAYDAVVFLIAVRIVASLFAYVFVAKELFVRGVFKLDAKIIKEIYVFSKFSFANSLGVFIFSKTDIFLLAFILNYTNVAVYASALVVTNIFRLLNEPMSILVLPMVSKLHHQRTPSLHQTIRRVYLIASSASLTISIPISLALLVFPQQILQVLYGVKYGESVALVRLFAIWGLIMPFYRCAATIFNGVSRPQINAKYTWLAGIANVLLNIPLIYYLQTNGAAIASIVTSFILLLVFLYTLQTMFHLFCFVPECSRNIVKAVD